MAKCASASGWSRSTADAASAHAASVAASSSGRIASSSHPRDEEDFDSEDSEDSEDSGWMGGPGHLPCPSVVSGCEGRGEGWATIGPPPEGSRKDGGAARRVVVPALALVAVEALRDEEVFLNYRLSTHVKRPVWYHPVNAEEDARRWAME